MFFCVSVFVLDPGYGCGELVECKRRSIHAAAAASAFCGGAYLSAAADASYQTQGSA